MKIFLTKDNVMRILCDHFNIPYIVVEPAGKAVPREDQIFWEGSTEPGGKPWKIPPYDKKMGDNLKEK